MRDSNSDHLHVGRPFCLSASQKACRAESVGIIFYEQYSRSFLFELGQLESLSDATNCVLSRGNYESYAGIFQSYINNLCNCFTEVDSSLLCQLCFEFNRINTHGWFRSVQFHNHEPSVKRWFGSPCKQLHNLTYVTSETSGRSLDIDS